MNQATGRAARSCLVDTSAYFALANRRDASHDRARLALTRLAATRIRLYTTNFILAEIHALLLNRLDRSLAYTFVQRLHESATTIVRVSQNDERRAWQIIERFTDKDFTFTDAASFAVMERLHIEQAFTLDADFARYGFSVTAITEA